MTEQNPNEPTPPGGEPLADEPIPDAGAAGDGTGNARAREWLTQLEAMIQDIATQAAPAARQVAAKAAELTAVAAVKAGPLMQSFAEATTDAGQRVAERAQSLAAELRSEAAASPAEDVPWTEPASAADGSEGAPEEATAAADDAAEGEADPAV